MKMQYLSASFFPCLLLTWPVLGSLNIDEDAENSDFEFEENTETAHQSTGETSYSFWESHAEEVDEPYVEHDAEQGLQELKFSNAKQSRPRKLMQAAAVATIIGFLVVSSVYIIHVQKAKAQKGYLKQQFELFKAKFEESRQAIQKKYQYFYNKKFYNEPSGQLYHLNNQSLKLERLFSSLNEIKNVFEKGDYKYEELLDDLKLLQKEFDD